MKIKVTIVISEETFLIKIHSLFLYLFLISNLEFDLGWEALRSVFVINFFVSFLYENLYVVFKRGRHYSMNIVLLVAHFLHKWHIQIK